MRVFRVLILVASIGCALAGHGEAAIRGTTLYRSNLPPPDSFATWGTEVSGLEAAVVGPSSVVLEDSHYYLALRNLAASPIYICPALEPTLDALDANQQLIKRDREPQFSSFQPGWATIEIDPGDTYVESIYSRIDRSYSSVPVDMSYLRADVKLWEAGPELKSCLRSRVTRLQTAPLAISLD